MPDTAQITFDDWQALIGRVNAYLLGLGELIERDDRRIRAALVRGDGISAEAVPSILTEDESERLKGLGVTGAMRPGKRAACQRDVEAIVREACARAMERLSAADPLCGTVRGICRLGAKRIRGRLT